MTLIPIGSTCMFKRCEMISIFDMSNRLVERGIDVRLSREPGQSVWVIHAQKGDDSGDWTVPADDVEMCYLARDIIRTMIINKILDFIKEKERKKEHEMKNNKQTFTRDDLKPGYVVKLRDDTCHIIAVAGNETLIVTNGTSEWKYLSSGWDYSLNSTIREGRPYPALTYDSSKDIVAVYGYVQGTENYTHAGYISSNHRPILWSRQEAKKMTVEEIEKELGYKVEIVSD